MTSLEVRVQTLAFEAADDDSLGFHLVDVVRRALAKGGAPSAAVAAHGDRVDLVPLGPVVQAKMPVPAFVSGLTRSAVTSDEPVAVVGLIGTFRLRRRPEEAGVPIAIVFLEWTDCRWWHWRGLLDPTDQKRILDETETVTRAVDGDPKPLRLGGWWSQARRRPIDLRWDRRSPAPMVH